MRDCPHEIIKFNSRSFVLESYERALIKNGWHPTASLVDPTFHISKYLENFKKHSPLKQEINLLQSIWLNCKRIRVLINKKCPRITNAATIKCLKITYSKMHFKFGSELWSYMIIFKLQYHCYLVRRWVVIHVGHSWADSPLSDPLWRVIQRKVRRIGWVGVV